MSYVEQCPHGPWGWCVECGERNIRAKRRYNKIFCNSCKRYFSTNAEDWEISCLLCGSGEIEQVGL